MVKNLYEAQYAVIAYKLGAVMGELRTVKRLCIELRDALPEGDSKRSVIRDFLKAHEDGMTMHQQEVNRFFNSWQREVAEKTMSETLDPNRPRIVKPDG